MIAEFFVGIILFEIITAVIYVAYKGDDLIDFFLIIRSFSTLSKNKKYEGNNFVLTVRFLDFLFKVALAGYIFWSAP